MPSGETSAAKPIAENALVDGFWAFVPFAAAPEDAWSGATKDCAMDGVSAEEL
jgi:hypothetical protein